MAKNPLNGKNGVFWLIGILIITIVISGLLPSLFSDSSIINRNNKMFIATIGFLTFASIFYGLSVSNGKEILESVEKIFINQKRILQKEINNVSKKNDTSDLKKDIEKLRNKIEDVDAAISYLNTNIWIFLCVISYIFSILIYLGGENQAIAIIQTISFWAGNCFLIVVITTWFMATQIYKKSKK